MKANSPLLSQQDGHFISIEVPKKRKFSRVNFKRQASLVFINDSYDNYQIKDVSLTGLFVVGSFRQEVGDNCIVNIVQKGISSTLSVMAAAKVVRTTDEGIALKITKMTFDSYMFLQTSLLYEADEPIAIGLELPDDCPFQIIEEPPTLTEKG